MSQENIWKLMATKTEGAGPIPSERVHALTTSTQFPNDELDSSRNPLQSHSRPYRRRGYYIRSLRGVLERLKAVAIGLVTIAILIAGLLVVGLLALDLLDMLRW
jgi:hypothetical protein